MILDYRKITDISEITDPGYESGGWPVYEICTWGPQGDHMLKVESPVWDHGNWQKSLDKLIAIYADIFHEASARSAKNLYLPLLGEGAQLIPKHRSSEALWKAACLSEYDGRCTVLLSEPFDLKAEYGQIHFDRPGRDIYIRISGEGIEPDDRLIVAEKAEAAAMHPVYFAPEAFVMNTCGVLNDGSLIVLMKALDLMSAGGPGVSYGHYEKDTCMIFRFKEGCGQINTYIPQLRRHIDIAFFTDAALLDAFKGCIIGGAAGDALGYPVEFDKYKQIKADYGEAGIRGFVLTDGKALISDDTQMTLFTMDGLRCGIARSYMKGIYTKPEVYISWAYQDWLSTQTNTRGKYNAFTRIYQETEKLDKRRAPGITCLQALSDQNVGSVNPPYSNKRKSVEDPANNSKGCGGVMRVAPIGLMASSDNLIARDGAARIAAEAAAITHGHPLGYLPAAYLGELIRRITYKTDGTAGLNEIMDRTLAEVNRQFDGTAYLDDLNVILTKAFSLADGQNQIVFKQRGTQSDPVELAAADAKNIHSIGGGWVAEEALAIALYCVRRYPYDFQEALRIAVNHSGDSDSTGAIAGNILGAWLGLKEMQRQTETAADKGDADPIHLADLELYDEMLRWTSEAFKMVMDPEVRNNRFTRPKSPEYISTGFSFDSFAVLDHENRKAYVWHNNEKKWKKSESLYVETEWGSEPYRSLELIPGSEISLES